MSYPDLLDAAWALHAAPREPDAPTVVSAFAGCGGSSLGYSMAGFRELLAIDWDDNAVATFKLNFPGVPVFHGDIADLAVDEVFRTTGLSQGQLDVLDGSPPCQGFSLAGARDLNDDRNQLFREYVRLLEGLRPKALLLENVSGMVRGKMKLVFAETMRHLKATGYRVSARLMNAMYFSVPQFRERMIFIGVRDDLGVKPSHPKVQSRPVTVFQAIGHLPPGEPGAHSEAVIEAWHVAKPYEDLRKASIRRPTRQGHYVGSFHSARLDPNRPSRTQTKTHLHWRWDVPRQLTTLEAAILGSFPPQFQWVGSKTQAKERIGNSVPPLFMKALAEHVRANVLGAAS
ncbi:MAG: DNA cytosine methyltransferase [Proteobacteria bacterium]|nr:DNA cytosine methyltransferase [Pseudomonadota bacterium]